jgi:hypothetical protein
MGGYTPYSGGSGADLWGNAIDKAPVSREFAGLYPEGTRGVQAAAIEVTDTQHTSYSGAHVHEHSDYQGGSHTHAHSHAGDASHDPGTGEHVQLPSRSHSELGNGLPG